MKRCVSRPWGWREMKADRRPPHAALVLATMLLGGTALAQGRPVVLEVYGGARPRDAAEYVDYLVRAMAADRPLTGAELRRAIDRHISRSAGPVQFGRRLHTRLEEGQREFIEGNYREAIRILDEVRMRLLRRVATVASDQGYRDALHRTLLFLAHAYLRAKQPDRATDRVSEAIRSFADRDLSLTRHSPELVSFYKKVRADLDRQRRGSLAVRTEPAGCMVFLNERFVGLSPTVTADLYPGKYRVFAQRGDRRGRIHEVTVSGDTARVSIDFGLDSVLYTEPFVGMRFDGEGTRRDQQVRRAASIGRALDAPLVVLIGFQQHESRRALVGTVVATSTARTLRSAMIALEPADPSPESFNALARFLLAGQRAPGIIVRAADAPALRPHEQEQRGARGWLSARTFKWVALGIAAGLLAGGGTALALHGRGTCDVPTSCPDVYQTRGLGIGLLAGGGAAAAAGIYLFWRDASHRRARTATLTPWIGRGATGGSLAFDF